MSKNTKILWLILLLAFIVSVSVTFYRTVVLGDFETIETEVETEE